MYLVLDWVNLPMHLGELHLTPLNLRRQVMLGPVRCVVRELRP
jgi:hypothetical protein